MKKGAIYGIQKNNKITVYELNVLIVSLSSYYLIF